MPRSSRLESTPPPQENATEMVSGVDHSCLSQLLQPLVDSPIRQALPTTV